MKLEKQHLRRIAFLVLAVVTICGFYAFFRGDWHASLAYWRGKGWVLCGAFGLHALNMALDAVLWMLVLREFGIRLSLRMTALLFPSAFAGLLFPMQLGRFIRSEAIGRLKLGSVGEAVKAEVVFLFLCAVAAVALLAGVLAWVITPLLAPVAALAVTAAFLFAADRVFALLSKTRVDLPTGYWRRGRTFVIAIVAAVGWLINGACLYLVVRDLPGDVGLLQAMFTAPASLLVGIGTGLPGGIGAIEGFLGVSLSLLDVPASHLALAVGAFRLVTFWLWIPIGWVAFTAVNRMASGARAVLEASSEGADGE